MLYTAKMNTKLRLEKISETCLSELTKYKFNKGLDISDKYRRGKIASLQYVLDLIYHFYEKDKLLKVEFEDLISAQIDSTSQLKSGDYRDGIGEVLKDVITHLNEK